MSETTEQISIKRIGVGIGIGVFVVSLVAGLIIWATIASDPFPSEICREAMPDVAVEKGLKADNGNILCKIIDADSVERSVWLDGDGVVLK